MRKLFLSLVLLAIAACSSSTAPSNAADPSLLFSNSTSAWVYVTWRDGAAIEGKDSVAPGTRSQCSRFTAQPDSAYFQITVTDVQGGTPETSTYTAPYFNPADRPAWTVDVSPVTIGSPSILVRLASTAC